MKGGSVAVVKYYVRSEGKLYCTHSTGIANLHKKLSRLGFESVDEIMEAEEARVVPYTQEEQARRDYVDSVIYRMLVELAIPQNVLEDLEVDLAFTAALRRAIGLWLVKHGLKVSEYEFYPQVKKVG